MVGPTFIITGLTNVDVHIFAVGFNFQTSLLIFRESTLCLEKSNLLDIVQ